MKGQVRTAVLLFLFVAFAFADYVELGGDGTALLNRPFCGS